MTSGTDGQRAERILIFDAAHEGPQCSTLLKTELPTAEVTATESVGDFEQALSKSDFDLLIVDYDLPEARNLQLLKQTKLRDDAPEILLVSSCSDLGVMRAIAESRFRYVLRDNAYVRSLPHAVRDLLRQRRLEETTLMMRAQLTETNYLLEEKNRRLDEFCATVAHDIRGPLAGLILKVEYILDSYGESFDDRCRKLLGNSLDSAERLVGIVQAMYEFAKVGSKASNPEMIDLRGLVLGVLADLNVEESRDVDVGVDQLPMVWGNAPLIRRIFINLINNAIKYGDKEKVLINIGHDGDEERGIGKFAKIFVEDNGPGVSESDAQSIFKMFARGHFDTSKNPEGLGVGLAVVQRIIELHFGTIELTSSLGNGCRFTFTLPREKVDLVK